MLENWTEAWKGEEATGVANNMNRELLRRYTNLAWVFWEVKERGAFKEGPRILESPDLVLYSTEPIFPPLPSLFSCFSNFSGPLASTVRWWSYLSLNHAQNSRLKDCLRVSFPTSIH